MTFREKVAKAFRARTYTHGPLARGMRRVVERYRTWREARAVARVEARRRRITVENLRRGIDEKALSGIQALGEVKDRADVFWTKYLDVDHWLAVNIKHAERLGLIDKPPRDVLDLGCGAGYFLVVCRALGARVQGLDVNNDQVLNRMIELFRLPRIARRIRPFVKLPDFRRRFDLITGFMICFNFPTNETYWSEREWDFFLDDVLGYLKPGGRMFFSLNKQPDGEFYSEELKAYFLSRGAEVKGKGVLLTCEGLQRTRRTEVLSGPAPSRFQNH